MESKHSSIFRGSKVSSEIEFVLKHDPHGLRQRAVSVSRYVSKSIKLSLYFKMQIKKNVQHFEIVFFSCSSNLTFHSFNWRSTIWYPTIEVFCSVILLLLMLLFLILKRNHTGLFKHNFLFHIRKKGKKKVLLDPKRKSVSWKNRRGINEWKQCCSCYSATLAYFPPPGKRSIPGNGRLCSCSSEEH